MVLTSYRKIKNRILFWKRCSEAVSFALHPLLMPTLLFSIILFFSPAAIGPMGDEAKRSFLTLIFIGTFIFPFFVITSYLMITKRNFGVQDLLMKRKQDRFVPFFFAGVFYIGMAYMLYTSRLNKIVVLIMIGIGISAIIVAIISQFWKISAHAVGINGIIGYMVILGYVYPEDQLFYPVVAMVLLSGLVMSARLNLQVHKPMEVLGGAVLGFAISIVTLVLMA